MTARGFLLGASVALNVFLLALLGTQLWHDRTPKPENPIERMTATLPEPDAARFRAAMEAERPSYQPARDGLSAARLDVAAAIGRVPFDPDRLAAAMRRWQESWRVFAARFDQALLAAVTAISDAGRAKLAEAAIAEDTRHRMQETPK